MSDPRSASRPAAGSRRSDATQVVSSASWDDAPPATVAVHVPTYRRPGFLPALIERIEAQTLPAERFELVVVDNGSHDRTWEVLQDAVGSTSLRLAAVRLADNRGPAGARNLAVATSRAPLLVFTDDDCLPTPGWLEAIVAASAGGADLVQGRTEPDPDRPGVGPWARSIDIDAASPLFETCNIAYRREAFDAAGGFDEGNAISARPGGRAFGEDVLLGSAVLARGGPRVFAPDAVVYHRNLPARYPDRLREMRALAGFPALARECPPLAEALWFRVFLTRETAAFDLAAVGVASAVLGRRARWSVLAVPWLRDALRRARAYGGRNVLVRLAQLALLDAVGAVSLLEGSVRHRRAVL